MPLIVDGGQVPPRWAEKIARRMGGSSGRFRAPKTCINVALVNNMPDPALEDTEMQFFELLDSAAGETPVHLKLYSLQKVPRGKLGRARLNSFYSGMEELLNGKCDGVIMTGTEPHQPELRKEPYWEVMADVFDWAERNTFSTVLSCLAAHASVLHSDGIARHGLTDKRFGVFEEKRVGEHALTHRVSESVRFPHSRWNEVRASELASCGYAVLTESSGAGVNLFVKKKKQSLFVHFQGHPEYTALTLLKEYRRDIKRFLRRERETYPLMPEGYFDAEATRAAANFQERAVAERSEELIASFPEAAVARTIENIWHECAHRIYRNWLKYVASKKGDKSASPATVRGGRSLLRPAKRARAKLR